MSDSFVVREADADDTSEIVACAGAALRWQPGDATTDLFRWKHLENPGGRSPMWVADHQGTVIGFRAMMRWTFERHDASVAAVRAVDTATHPNHQGRGVFRTLTDAAVCSLRSTGTSFVFNTPNDHSRPGYLRMGWTEQGRLAVRVHPRGVASLATMARSRAPAQRWSEPLTYGDHIDSVADHLAELAGAAGSSTSLRTRRDAAHLRWRYGFEPLHYRVLQTHGAAAVVRVRTRGAAREAVIAELFASDRAAAKAVIAAAVQIPGVDYALRLHNLSTTGWGGVPLPGSGPRLLTRALAEPAPDSTDFDFTLGDIELL